MPAYFATTFLSFAILLFYLAITTSFFACLISLLLFGKLKYSLDIFKPGFKAGSVSILTLLFLGFAFESVETKLAELESVYLFPIFFILIGYIIGIVNVFRIKKKENNSIFL